MGEGTSSVAINGQAGWVDVPAEVEGPGGGRVKGRAKLRKLAGPTRAPRAKAAAKPVVKVAREYRRAAKPVAAPVVKAARKRRPMRGKQKLALCVGGVGLGLLSLSVTHCTESIGLLTGSPWQLAGLLAVGIDAGMVVAELAELNAHGTAEAYTKGSMPWDLPVTTGDWARRYVLVAVLLSVLLNGYAFGLHAVGGMQWAAWALGAVIPGLMYCLGRVAGGLWLAD